MLIRNQAIVTLVSFVNRLATDLIYVSSEYDNSVEMEGINNPPRTLLRKYGAECKGHPMAG